jgi:hypothetical protein
MAGTHSVATTAISSSKVAVVDSGEVGRSAVYSRYNNAIALLHCYLLVHAKFIGTNYSFLESS